MKNVITGIALSFLVVSAASAGESPDVKRLKGKIKFAQEKLDSANRKVEGKKADLERIAGEAKDAQDLVDSINELIVAQRENEASIDEREATFEKIAVLVTGYREHFRSRVNFTEGETLGTVVLNGGRKLEGVVVKEVTDTSIKIGHSGGFGQIDLAELPESLQDRVVGPPSTDAIAIDPQSILEKRPLILMSEEEKRLRSERQYSERREADQKRMDEQRTARDAEYAARAAERREMLEAENAKRLRDQQARRATLEKQDDIRSKISSLRSEITQYNDAITYQTNVKNFEVARISRGSIKPSAAKVRETEKPYNDKIAQIRALIAEKEKEIATLEAEYRSIR